MRKCFPEFLAGTYTDEEMEQADNKKPLVRIESEGNLISGPKTIDTNLRQDQVDTNLAKIQFVPEEIIVEDRNAQMTASQTQELVALMIQLPQENQDKIWTHLREKNLNAWEDFKIKDFYHYRDLIAQRVAISKRTK